MGGLCGHFLYLYPQVSTTWSFGDAKAMGQCCGVVVKGTHVPVASLWHDAKKGDKPDSECFLYCCGSNISFFVDVKQAFDLEISALLQVC